MENDEEIEWVSLDDAEARTGHKKRNIRLWANDGKIRSQKESDRPNSKMSVAIVDLEKFSETRPPDAKETLPIPMKVFEEMQKMSADLATTAAARAKAETIAEFTTEQVRDLKRERDELKRKLADRDAADAAIEKAKADAELLAMTTPVAHLEIEQERVGTMQRIKRFLLS